MPAKKSTTINISEVKDVLSVTESKEAGFVACLDSAASQHGNMHQAFMKTRQVKEFISETPGAV